MNTAATALIADDEPLLRERLRTHLARLWPELAIVAEARNGREAIELFEAHAPRIVFLDVHMPGRSGIDAARAIARRAQIVFVTAHDKYAVEAFEHGAIDYLVKPFDEARLADTIARLRDGPLRRDADDPDTAQPKDDDALGRVLDRLAAELQRRGLRAAQASSAEGTSVAPGGAYLQWIRASVGTSVRLIPVEQVAYLRADEKYTLVVWEGGEALIRKTIRELADELDPQRFAQIHRSVIVNLHQVTQVQRGLNETAEVHLKGRSDVLPVSRSFVHVFRQM
ncbi:MAG TPA: LytTR family DNA-binding domain-containing protein [Burkholderiaceae bacterium]|nr:LytTR family DNA-binding domain-containing protein [Burkholderiaceae bacterium]